MMTMNDVLFILALLSVPFLVYKCQPSPDIACQEVCKQHGEVLEKRVSHLWIQECECVKAKH